MKYLVTGSNRDTGARMSLEFEAESKAAAERKATQSGMVVNFVRDVTDGPVATATEPAARRRSSGRGSLLIKLVVLAAILLAAYYFLLPMIR